MEDWKALGQVGGGIVAYAILVKVFEFVQTSRRGSFEERHGEVLREVRGKVDRVLRLVTRIHDRQQPDRDDFDA